MSGKLANEVEARVPEVIGDADALDWAYQIIPNAKHFVFASCLSIRSPVFSFDLESCAHGLCWSIAPAGAFWSRRSVPDQGRERDRDRRGVNPVWSEAMMQTLFQCSRSYGQITWQCQLWSKKPADPRLTYINSCNRAEHNPLLAWEILACRTLIKLGAVQTNVPWDA